MTPHGGTTAAYVAYAISGFTGLWHLVDKECFSAYTTLNRRELEADSPVIRLLNTNVSRLPSDVTIASIQSYTIPGLFDFFGGDDGIVTTQQQSIENVAASSLHYDLPNFFDPRPACVSLVFPFAPLHNLNCVGIQPSTANLIEQQVVEVMHALRSEEHTSE